MARRKGFGYFVICNGKSVPVSLETYKNIVLSMKKDKK